MARYLERMPEGLASYPSYLQKGSLFRTCLQGVDVKPHVHHLPGRLAARVMHLPLATDWIPEVEATAVYLALIDLCFDGSEERFVEYSYEVNRKLLESVLYRVLFRLAGTERVARGLAGRWTLFHQGIGLSSRPGSDQRGLEVTLDFPSGMVPRVIAGCYVTAFRAALGLAGGNDVLVRIVEETPTSLRIAVTWR